MEFLLGVAVGIFATYNFILTNPAYDAKIVEYNTKLKSFIASFTKSDK